MFLKHTYPALLWALFIAILCGMPGKDIPHISFLELLQFDKLVHAGVFFILTYLLLNAFQKQTNLNILIRYPFFAALLFSIAYGGLLELLQALVFIDRSADVFDFIANSFGSLMTFFISKKRKFSL